jgi:tetratricopeptide (TPR) repeat protein
MAAAAHRLDVAKERWEKFLALGGDDFDARIGLAKLNVGLGKDSAEAVRHLEAAQRCFPRQIGKDSPHLGLAALHEGAGATARAVAEYEAYAAIAQEDYGVRKKLAAWYASQKDDAALIRVSREMIEISPFGAKRSDPPDLDLHRGLAQALARAGKKDEAATEWRVQSLLVDRLPEAERKAKGGVEARLERGKLLLELGRADEALEEALGALAIDPDSGPARALEQKAREAGGGR